MKKHSGFTLVELLVTLTLIIILSMMIIPSYSSLIYKMHSDKVIMQLDRAIKFARSEAIHDNYIVTVCPTTDHDHCSNNWSNGYMLFIDHDGNGAINQDDQIVKYFIDKVPGRLTWRSFPHDHHYLQLTPLGYTNHQNGTFYYFSPHNPKWTSSLRVSQTARLMVVLH